MPLSGRLLKHDRLVPQHDGLMGQDERPRESRAEPVPPHEAKRLFLTSIAYLPLLLLALCLDRLL